MYSKIFKLHADLFKSLSHPRRLEIVHLLRDQELAAGDIHTMLDLPQANISQHLTILRESKIVNTRREGKQIFYSLSDIKIIKASDLFREFLVDSISNKELIDQLSLKMKDLLPLVHDPVCKMRVSPKTAGFHKLYKDHDYYFCASGCLKKFESDPDDFIE